MAEGSLVTEESLVTEGSLVIERSLVLEGSLAYKERTRFVWMINVDFLENKIVGLAENVTAGQRKTTYQSVQFN